LVEDSHECEIPKEGDCAVGEMEAEELGEERGVVATVAPGVVEVPSEVVYYGELDDDGGVVEVVAWSPSIQEEEGGELDADAHQSDEIELEPAGELVHDRGSSR
jgi:hypothetical protein